MIVHVSGQSESPQTLQEDRLISTYPEAFGILRKGLIKHIGMQRMKGFLLSYGWEMGVSDARKEMASDSSLENLLKQGPVYHHLNGYIQSIVYEADFKFVSDQSIASVHGKGTWIGSYEAEEHVKRISISDTPVCHINVGYLNGYLTTVCNHPIIVKEISCVGMGDDKCEWILKSQDLWEEDIQEELQYYHQTPIVKELEFTYEQLLEQRNSITKISNVHKRLTEEIINGNDLQSIVDIAYEITDIPCIIQDRNFRALAYSGLTKDDFLQLELEFNAYIQKNKTNVPLFKRGGNEVTSVEGTVISTEKQSRLIVPVTVRKQIIGYCIFLYIEGKSRCRDNDLLILERVSNAVSLFLLNEKTSFEAFERMKGNFLEQLLNNQYASRKEIIRRGTYVNIDLSQPFHIVVVGYVSKQADNMNDEFLLHEQIIETAHAYFKNQKRNVLIGQREGNIVCLICKEADKESEVFELSIEFMDYLEESFKNCEFQFGISTVGKQIESATQYYDEALLAQRMTVTKKIVSFADLGVVGVLINSSNAETIKALAINMLGPLYSEDGFPDDKLIKTLYIFLANGGRLEQTMLDLQLSMSGLLYRIKKIETAIKKDLRAPEDSHQLFLILEALIALGELEIE